MCFIIDWYADDNCLYENTKKNAYTIIVFLLQYPIFNALIDIIQLNGLLGFEPGVHREQCPLECSISLKLIYLVREQVFSKSVYFLEISSFEVL